MRVAESTMTSSATVSTKARRSLTIGANAPFAKVKVATWEQIAKHATVLDGCLCAAALGIEKTPDRNTLRSQSRAKETPMPESSDQAIQHAREVRWKQIQYCS